MIEDGFVNDIDAYAEYSLGKLMNCQWQNGGFIQV